MMKRSESIAKLADALAKAQAKIEAAVKDRTNPHFKSDYATLSSVWDACRVPLTENGLSIVQTPATDGAKVTLTTLMLHSSGEWIESELTMAATKSDPQGIGSCLTYARRYALAAITGVAPDDDDDGNAASHDEPAHRQSNGSHKPPVEPPAKAPEQPAVPAVRKNLNAKLKAIGCRDTLSADAVCDYVSEHAFPTVEAARATEATMEHMLALLSEATVNHMPEDILKAALDIAAQPV